MKTKQKKAESILYIALWTILFIAPLLSMLIGSMKYHEYDWEETFAIWKMLFVFLLTFTIHNYFIAPLLVYHNQKWKYGIFVVILLAVFETYQINTNPHHPDGPHGRLNRMERFDKRPQELKRYEHKKFDRGHRSRQRPPIPRNIMGGPNTISLIIMSLLLGLNVGVKNYFKSVDDRKRMKELERENLQQQLEYLKYQINPHFFMNTLNNIHALVDINPEQAKYTIEVLSRLMRYMLYEGNKNMAPLQREIEFIGHYIDLMRIRYTDRVKIEVSLPSSVTDVNIPPLLFITFVENAFKHGVSYSQTSKIDVRIWQESDESIKFKCYNTRKPSQEDSHGGVGLQNTQKRLDLIYGTQYKLKITPTEKDYLVELTLPKHP